MFSPKNEMIPHILLECKRFSLSHEFIIHQKNKKRLEEPYYNITSF